MADSVWAADFAARLMHNEGFRISMYHDSLGVPTIGCGFNLERADASEALAACGVPPNLVQSVIDGTLSMSTTEVGRLLAYSDEPIVTQARARLEPGHFDSMAPARRAAFCDIDFNLGSAGLGAFVHFLRLIDGACHYMRTEDLFNAHTLFGLAADDLLRSTYAKQVGVRALRNASMIRTSSYVAIDAFE